MTVGSKKTPWPWCVADARSPASPAILGVTTWSLARWVQIAKTGQEQREPKTLPTETEEARAMRRLRQANDYLRQQRDILKKALGILSAEVPPHATR